MTEVEGNVDITDEDRIALLDEISDVHDDKITDLYNHVAELQQKFTTLQNLISPMVMRLAQTMPGGAPQLVDEQQLLINARSGERKHVPVAPVRYGAKRS
jgi:hypothetical protein